MKKQIQINPDAKALIFDLDGTLVDSMPAHYEAWRKTFFNYGFDLSVEQLYKFAGIPSLKVSKLLINSFNANLSPRKLIEEKEAIFIKCLNNIKIIEPVVEIVLKNYKKIPMAVGTGGIRSISMLLLKNNNLEKYFDIIITAEDVKKHKPEPETFTKCADYMKVSYKYCQVFEDADNGIIAAKKAGMMVTDLREFL